MAIGKTGFKMQLLGLGITFGVAGLLAWGLVELRTPRNSPPPPDAGTLRGYSFWITNEQQAKNALKNVEFSSSVVRVSLPAATPAGLPLRAIGNGQATAINQVIFDYYPPSFAPPLSPAPLPTGVPHVQARVMRRAEMQTPIVEPIDLGLPGVTAGLTALSQNDRFSWDIPEGDAYAVIGPAFAWRVLVWREAGLSHKEAVTFLRALAQESP